MGGGGGGGEGRGGGGCTCGCCCGCCCGYCCCQQGLANGDAPVVTFQDDRGGGGGGRATCKDDGGGGGEGEEQVSAQKKKKKIKKIMKTKTSFKHMYLVDNVLYNKLSLNTNLNIDKESLSRTQNIAIKPNINIHNKHAPSSYLTYPDPRPHPPTPPAQPPYPPPPAPILAPYNTIQHHTTPNKTIQHHTTP